MFVLDALSVCRCRLPYVTLVDTMEGGMVLSREKRIPIC
jgi:hypothetical protein